MKLTRKQQKAVQFEVDDLYNKLQARLLGRFFKGPKIYFEIVENTDPLDTMEGMFRYALNTLYGPKVDVNENILKLLTDTTKNYLDAAKLKARNQVIHDIFGAKNIDEVVDLVEENMDKATSYINTLLVTEVRNVSATAEKDGIAQVAADMGVEDPHVCKVGVKDSVTCKVCKHLWWQDYNKNIPKVYKLSELKDGYNKSQKLGKAEATVLPTHPHCRCVLTFIPPGFSFNDSGMLTFKGLKHDEWEHQRK